VRDATVEDQTVLVSDKGYGAVTHLGPNLELRRCALVLRISARQLMLLGPQLTNCFVDVKRKLHNVKWLDAYLERRSPRGGQATRVRRSGGMPCGRSRLT